MSATIERPLPQCVAPAPLAPCCGECEGVGCFDDADFGELACPSCGGSGAGTWVPVCEFMLNPSRSHKNRVCRYDANAGRLSLTQGKKTQRYTVCEFKADAEYGLAFALAKEDGTIYRLQCGRVGVTCDCSGETYQSAAKANQRALERGDDLFPTFGCVHADSLVPLLRAGWFDVILRPEPSVT